MSGPASPRVKRATLVNQKAEAALKNEEITRRRVDVLEGAAQATALLLSRPLWGRLKWLLTGK